MEAGQDYRVSEATLALDLVGNFIKDSILVSAYDIYHGHLRDPGRYFPDKELIFIDSGGYELSPALTRQSLFITPPARRRSHVKTTFRHWKSFQKTCPSS